MFCARTEAAMKAIAFALVVSASFGLNAAEKLNGQPTTNA
jgi:hypothetical protein